MFWKIMGYISGPLIGAVIGYITNYIAVKMLFRPYTQKKIGKFKIPFTPGVIPKRQPKLAKAIGRAVGEDLFTKEDFSQIICNKMEDVVIPYEKSINDFLPQGEITREGLSKFIADKMSKFISQINLGELVAEKGLQAVNEKKASLGMLAMFISDDLITSLLSGFGDKLTEGICNSDQLYQEVKKSVDEICADSLDNLIANKVSFEKAVKGIISNVVSNNLQIVDTVDISEIVEKKVLAMDVRDLEKLCLSVMKKELNAVVNLGAIIGLLLGIVNIFI